MIATNHACNECFCADYGDSGIALYDQITHDTMKVHCVHNCIRAVFGGQEQNDKYMSPFDLHPYIYIGVVECPEDNDAGPEGQVAPCVAQSSRYYPVHDLYNPGEDQTDHPIDPLVSGIRRKKFDSIRDESLFVWRITNEVARLRAVSYALSITNPWVAKVLHPKMRKEVHEAPPTPCKDYPAPWGGDEGKCKDIAKRNACAERVLINGYTPYEACCHCYHQELGWGGRRLCQTLSLPGTLYSCIFFV